MDESTETSFRQPNLLLQGQGGRFVDVTALAGPGFEGCYHREQNPENAVPRGRMCFFSQERVASLLINCEADAAVA